MSYRIEKSEAPAAGIRRIVRAQLERALHEGNGLGGPEETNAVHNVRKRVKKIRAVLRMVEKEIGSEVYHEENQRLRVLADIFSDLREADVHLQVLEKLRSKLGLEAGDFADVIENFTAQQRKAAEQQEGRHDEAIELLASLHDRVEGWPLDDLNLRALCCALQHTYRKARKCLHHVLDHRTSKTFHSWRKHTKRVWYQARILEELESPVMREIAHGADVLGSYLGDLHDLACLRAPLQAAMMSESDRTLLLGLICAREKALEQIVIDLGCRFYAEKPAAFRRRLLRYAEAWPAAFQT